VKRYLIGAVVGIAVAGLAFVAVLYFADLEIAEEMSGQEVTLPGFNEGGATTDGAESVTVPSVISLPPRDAVRALKEAGLFTSVSQEVGEAGPDGGPPPQPNPSSLVVIEQVPEAGTEVGAGSSVEIYVAPE
jgi:hypothetical protein